MQIEQQNNWRANRVTLLAGKVMAGRIALSDGARARSCQRLAMD
jgi:hypothetical protein